MKCKCLPYNKNYSNKSDEELKKRLKNTCKFSNNNINKFILLLRKGVYHYEYVNECEKFNETSLPEKKKKKKKRNSNKENITDADYMHAKRFCKDF